ncbi:MAG: hypothetical protein A2078_00025 [Nitrospirae bacterium GWC2_57_9]|nr:MAG: hypothetical protein A2078_00025 [Nitrospirae bacterium GWC2_57_9]
MTSNAIKIAVIGLILTLSICIPAGPLLHAETASIPAPEKIPFPRPDSHRGNWIEFHGASADLHINEAGRTRKACLMCHEKNDCIICHNTRLPRDHTNTWRTLSHGFMAEGNRERCLTCHRQDFCVRCHNETAPRSHTGNWRARHCAECHFGSGNSITGACTVCHRQAVHVSAPHPVNPAMNCALCHH